MGDATRGPVPTAATTAAREPSGAHAHGWAGHDDGVLSAGLVATAAGHTLVPQVSTLGPGQLGEYAFSITSSDGRAVTAYDLTHGRALHLVVVRRDGVGFQHLHPVLGGC